MQFTQPKTKAGNRSVSVPPALMAMLAEHVRRAQVKQSGLIFPDEQGRPLRNSSFRRVWLRVVSKAELDGFVFHELRHTAAALAIGQGAHPTAIKERLGHASIVTTLDRYGGLFPSLDRNIATGIDESVRRATSVPRRPATEEHSSAETGFGL